MNRFDDSPPPFDEEKRRTKKRICVWCGGQLPKRKRRWCSKACVDEYLARRSGKGLRDFIWKRDLGVCRYCGLDCGALYEALRPYYRGLLRERTHWPKWNNPVLDFPYLHFLSSFGRQRQLWEAHHVIPISKGGDVGPGNVITLCSQCHRAETSALKSDCPEGMLCLDRGNNNFLS